MSKQYTPSVDEARMWYELGRSAPTTSRAEFDCMVAHVRAEERERILCALIGPRANLDASVRSFKAGWHHADAQGREGERVSEGLRTVVADRIEKEAGI